MKITKSYIKEIIQEELKKALNERPTEWPPQSGRDRQGPAIPAQPPPEDKVNVTPAEPDEIDELVEMLQSQAIELGTIKQEVSRIKKHVNLLFKYKGKVPTPIRWDL